MIRWVFYIFFLVYPASGVLFAQRPDTLIQPAETPLIVRTPLEDYPLGGYLDILEDTSRQLQLQTLLDTRQDAFTRSPQKNPNFGVSSSAYWGRFTLKNPSDKALELILVYRYSSIDDIRLFAKNGKGDYQEKVRGDRQPQAEDRVHYRMPAFKILVPPGENTFFLQISGTGVMQFDLTLWDLEAFYLHRTWEYSFLFLLFGFLLVMLLYNIFLAVMLRTPGYYLYVAFLFFSMFTNLAYVGLTLELFPNWNWAANEGYMLFANSAVIAAAAFCISFLELQTRNRALFWTCFGMGTLGGLGIVSSFFNYSLSAKISIFSALVASLITLVSGLISSWKGFRPAYFYTLAWLALMLGSGVRMLSLYGVLPQNLLTLWGQFVGTAVEVVLLSLALGDKMRLLQETAQRRIAGLNADLQAQNVKIRDLNHQLEDLVEQKTRNIRSILQNIKLGIFTLDADSKKMEPEYSRHMEVLFERKEFGLTDVDALLFRPSKLSPDYRSRALAALDHILGENVLSFEFNRDNLPTELHVAVGPTTKIFDIDWNIIEHNNIAEKLLVTVKDVTEVRKLQDQAKAQERELSYISEIINVSSEQLNRFLQSSSRFIEENSRLIHANQRAAPEILKILFVNCHTMKGAARALNLQHAVEVIHKAEEHFADIQNLASPWIQDEVVSFNDDIKTEIDLYAYLNKVRLGRDPQQLYRFEMDIILMQDLFHTLESIRTGQTYDPTLLNKIHHTLQQKMFTDATEVLKEVLSGARSLAKDLGKINPDIEINNPGIYFSPNGQELVRSTLIHLLRNSMDHGIERPNERKVLGKSEKGRIHVTLKLGPEGLQLRYWDDGRGLDFRSIREIAMVRGVILQDQTMTNHQNAMLIFESGLSTASSLTDISGRGVGMDAVRKYVEKVGGRIFLELDNPDPKAERSGFAIIMTIPAHLYYAPREQDQLKAV
jgi:hypothetical protein